MHRIAILALAFVPFTLDAADDPYASRWAELRRRIAEGGNVQDLVRQWNSSSLPEIRTRAPLHPLAPRRNSATELNPGHERLRSLACEVGVPPSLALAILEHESGFDNRVVGVQGELGAGQILPATAANFGFDQGRLAADFDYNVRSAMAILRWLLDHFSGDEQAAIRGYNGGPGWQSAAPTTIRKIEAYAEAVNELRRKYVYANCE